MSTLSDEDMRAIVGAQTPTMLAKQARALSDSIDIVLANVTPAVPDKIRNHLNVSSVVLRRLATEIERLQRSLDIKLESR